MSNPNIVHGYRAGFSNAASYIVSGKPFITGSSVPGGHPNNGEVEITFPAITKSFTVVNRSAVDIIIHFDTRSNVNVYNQHHYITLSNTGDSFGFDDRVRRVFVSLPPSWSGSTGSFELHAELTGIDPNSISQVWPSGSGINEH